MSNHQPPRVPTWEEQTPAARARITRLTREADAQNAADREPTEAEKEAYTREVFEHELRGAHARFKASTGHGTRADATFDEWLRAEATEDPSTMLMAQAVAQAQDAERTAKRWTDAQDAKRKHRSAVRQLLNDIARDPALGPTERLEAIRDVVDTAYSHQREQERANRNAQTR